MAIRHSSKLLTPWAPVTALILWAALVLWAAPALGQDFPPRPTAPDLGPYVVEATLPTAALVAGQGAGPIILGTAVAFVTGPDGIASYRREDGAWVAGPALPAAPAHLGKGMDFDGRTLLVGMEDHVVVYEEQRGCGWCVVATLTSPTPASPANTEFGRAVAIDGDRAMVNGNFGVGVWSYRRSDGTWMLDSPTPIPIGGDPFVRPNVRHLSLRGDRLAVTTIESAGDSTTLRLYRHNGETWMLDEVIDGRDASREGNWRTSIAGSAISPDLLVWSGERWCPAILPCGNGPDPDPVPDPRAHLLRRTASGWVEEAVYGQLNDLFGIARPSLSDRRVALGAHILERTSSGWIRVAYFGDRPVTSALRDDRLLIVQPATDAAPGSVTVYRVRASAEGTTVPPARAILDNQLARWTFGPGGETLRDGVHVGAGGGGYGQLYWWGGGHLYVHHRYFGWFLWVEETGWEWYWY